MIEPYYSEDGIILYCAKCEDVLPRLTERVNLCITDPPYGVRGEDWDNKDDEELARFTMQWLSYSRVRWETLITFWSEKQLWIIYPLLQMLYPRVRQMFWSKPLGTQYAGAAEDGVWFSQELIFHCRTQRDYLNPKMMKVGRMITEARQRIGLSKGGVDMVVRGKKTGLCYRWEEAACLPTDEQVEKLKNLLGLSGEFERVVQAARLNNVIVSGAIHRDVFEYANPANSRHPCEKPIGLMKELLDIYTKRGQLILDPFCGVGTTLVAAKCLGRGAIGIEMSEAYCKIAVDRLRQMEIPFPKSAK